MDIRDRIKRRQRPDDDGRLVTDYEAVSPVVHPEEPVDRGQALERLLDVIDPAFDGVLPDTSYVWGPKGVGKTSLLRALFRALVDKLGETPIYTSTRVGGHDVDVVPMYVDARRFDSVTGLYGTLLDALGSDAVASSPDEPDELRPELETELKMRNAKLLVAVDHLGEPETRSVGAVADALAAVDEPISWMAAGRTPPEELGDVEPDPRPVHVAPYDRTVLGDILTTATSGIASRGMRQGVIDPITEWADGDAHDALGALFLAADRADREGNAVVTEENVADAIAAAEPRTVSIGRLLALPEARQRVLEELVATRSYTGTSVDDLATVIANRNRIDMPPNVVARHIHDLCDAGILGRVEPDAADPGQEAGGVETRFAAELYSRLRTIEGGSP